MTQDTMLGLVAGGGVVLGLLAAVKLPKLYALAAKIAGAKTDSTLPVVVVNPISPPPNTPTPVAVTGVAAQQPLPVSPPHPLVQELKDFEAGIAASVQQKKTEAVAQAEREGQEMISAFRKSLLSFIKTWNHAPTAQPIATTTPPA